MSDSFPCPNCMTWHAPPKCDHDAEAPCCDCGLSRGYRWSVDKGKLYEPADRCWFCATGEAR